MKIFVAGATGALGRRLLPLLKEAGHSVVGMTRSAEKTAAIRQAGAEAVVADALDKEAVVSALKSARPEVVIHELTAIPARLNIRQIDREFTLTNRLRREGTDYLLAGALAAGARRFIAQSYAAWPYERSGGPVKSEEDPLDTHPPEKLQSTLDAIRHLESAVLNTPRIEGIVLRYGAFYGAGSGIGERGAVVDDVRKGKLPIVGSGQGVWSFIHLEDAARATVAAVDRGAPGLYNISDDEPAPVSEWLPALAEAVGGRRPAHVPAFLAQLLIGEPGVVMMTEIRGASNAKAKRQLQWQPRWPTWRDGFRKALAS